MGYFMTLNCNSINWHILVFTTYSLGYIQTTPLPIIELLFFLEEKIFDLISKIDFTFFFTSQVLNLDHEPECQPSLFHLGKKFGLFHRVSAIPMSYG